MTVRVWCKEHGIVKQIYYKNLRKLYKEKFGTSSEKTTTQIEGQLFLFNEAEAEVDVNAQEPLIERKGCIYKRKPKSTREELLKDIPVEEVYCIIHPDDMFCDQCGSSLVASNSVVCVMYQKYVNSIPLYR